MVNNDVILKAIHSLQSIVTTIQSDVIAIHADLTKTQSDVATIKTRQQEQGKDIASLRQEQAQTNTVLEAVVGGQKEMQETMATKADVINLGAKIHKTLKQHGDRIDALEDEVGISHSHKN